MVQGKTQCQDRENGDQGGEREEILAEQSEAGTPSGQREPGIPP